MDYARFIKNRRGIWEDFESRLELARRQPKRIGYDGLERLALLYRQILHDHALAVFRFPATSAATEIRRLALEGTHWLNWDMRDRVASPSQFFIKTFPRTFRRNLPCLAMAVFLFLVAALFGSLLTISQPGLGTAFLGDSAIQGLREGHLWTESLVSTIPPSVSSSMIATNNMSVAITGWAGGALGGLGSLYILLLNGFMLGAVFGITNYYSMADSLFDFVIAHGLLEITLILVTAAAGLGMGRAFVEASDRPRSDAIRDAGRDALVILLGCLPWFILLGIVEGFISPSPLLTRPLKSALGLSLETIFLMIAWNPFLREEAP